MRERKANCKVKAEQINDKTYNCTGFRGQLPGGLRFQHRPPYVYGSFFACVCVCVCVCEGGVCGCVCACVLGLLLVTVREVLSIHGGPPMHHRGVGSDRPASVKGVMDRQRQA